jgi:hypothetical protein
MEFDVGRTLVVTMGVVVLATVAVVAVTFGGLGGVTDSDASVADLEPEDFPDGVTRAGVVNGSAAAQAHRDSLDGRSFALEIRVRRTLEDGDRQATTEVTQTVRDAGDGRVQTDVVQRSTAGSFERNAWTNDSVGVQRQVVRNQTQYSRIRPSGLQNRSTGHLVVGEFLSVGDFSPTSVTTVDGIRYIILRAEEARENAASRLSARSVESVTGKVSLSTDGRVRRMNISIRYVDERGRTLDVRVTQRLSGVGTTPVDRPSWVDEALSRT